MNISFYTFGCNVNKYETQEMRRLFLENGDHIIEDGEGDVIIINSCAVTSSAENGCVELIKRIKKKNPKSVVALVGCCGESADQKMFEYANADIILGNDKFSVVKEVHRVLSSFQDNTSLIDKHKQSVARAFLQIQNGCDNYCSYCIVPYLRGNPVSKSLCDIKNELRTLISQGCKEIVLSGINPGLYRHGEHTLIDVLETVNSVDSLESIRLSSLEPMTLSDEFINRLPLITKLQPHLHISLQSGCDRILSLMNRRYTFEDYLSIISRIREKIKNVALTTDIIVGFPDENENDFSVSCNNIIKCQFSDIHIFKYSKRNGTAAAQMHNQVTAHQKSARATFLEGIKSQARYNYNIQFIGSTERVAIIKKHSLDIWEGVTPHNIKILINADGILNDGFFDVEITGISDNSESLIGKRLTMQRL